MANQARQSVVHLLRAINSASCQCPAHTSGLSLTGPLAGANRVLKRPATGSASGGGAKEYAFEMACSNIRYGAGVTREVGMDMVNLGCRKVCVMTDKGVAKLPAMEQVVSALQSQNLEFQVFKEVQVEPSDSSFQRAIDFARNGAFDGFIAVGGGSVMDTCKTANLLMCKPSATLLDYVAQPIGKGIPIEHALKPLVAIPTTAGTGSETTGVAIFDYKPLKAKVGLSGRSLRPTLGLVDPLHTLSMPERVCAYSGFDVLCHALESYTALPYTDRSPRPDNPKNRPAYQGSNPISDVWSLHALRIVAKYMKRAVYDQSDLEARSAMHLASSFAGIGFGNAGVHLCHGMSYPISGLVRDYRSEGYSQNKALVPHGLSVVVTAPAVFEFTSSMCPERHIEAAGILGGETRGVKTADAGKLLSDTLRKFMQEHHVVDGLHELGYSAADIPALVKGTLPQHRVTKLAPRPQTEEDLAVLFENSIKIY